jgi:hypothetical protein
MNNKFSMQTTTPNVVKILSVVPQKAYGGVDVEIHISLASALAEGEWSASRPGSFTSGEIAPGTHWIEGSMGPRAGLDDVEK